MVNIRSSRAREDWWATFKGTIASSPRYLLLPAVSVSERSIDLQSSASFRTSPCNAAFLTAVVLRCLSTVAHSLQASGRMSCMSLSSEQRWGVGEDVVVGVRQDGGASRSRGSQNRVLIRTPTAAPVEELCGARAVTNVQTELRSFKEAALAYLILAHDKFVQVRRLVARLLPPSDGLALVHLDQKVATESQLEDFRRWAARSFDNGRERVRIFSEFSVHRGGRSMLDVQLRAIALLLASPVAWEYYINLSDTHYPADAASWFASYLWLHRGTNYARITSTKYYDPTLQGGRHASYSGPRAEDVYIACDRSLAFECEGQLFSLTPGEKFPALFAGVTSASGPEWVILSRSFLAYVDEGLKEGESLVSRLYDDLVSLSIPEETFFQTLLLTSPFCNTLLRHEFLYLDLYDAPWRASPQSDFPFQSPRRLNVTHLPDIAKEKPWFVRKIDAAQPGSAALRASLEAAIARRSRDGRWLTARIPPPLSRALGMELQGAEFQHRVAVSAHLAPRCMRVRLMGTPRGGPRSPSLRRARAAGSLLLTERGAVARREALPREVLPPVVALRVGCGWDEDSYLFHGDVSLIDASDCPNASLVSYLNNVGFEGEVAIHWYLSGQLQRQSGGRIPKGFSMFVDNLRDPVPGQWSVRLTDVTSGHRIGERGFIVYDARDAETWPSLEDYMEFFDFSPSIAQMVQNKSKLPAALLQRPLSSRLQGRAIQDSQDQQGAAYVFHETERGRPKVGSCTLKEVVRRMPCDDSSVAEESADANALKEPQSEEEPAVPAPEKAAQEATEPKAETERQEEKTQVPEGPSVPGGEKDDGQENEKGGEAAQIGTADVDVKEKRPKDPAEEKVTEEEAVPADAATGAAEPDGSGDAEPPKAAEEEHQAPKPKDEESEVTPKAIEAPSLPADDVKQDGEKEVAQSHDIAQKDEEQKTQEKDLPLEAASGSQDVAPDAAPNAAPVSGEGEAASPKPAEAEEEGTSKAAAESPAAPESPASPVALASPGPEAEASAEASPKAEAEASAYSPEDGPVDQDKAKEEQLRKLAELEAALAPFATIEPKASDIPQETKGNNTEEGQTSQTQDVKEEVKAGSKASGEEADVRKDQSSLFANVALDEKGTEARKKAAKSAREREEKEKAEKGKMEKEKNSQTLLAQPQEGEGQGKGPVPRTEAIAEALAQAVQAVAQEISEAVSQAVSQKVTQKIACKAVAAPEIAKAVAGEAVVGEATQQAFPVAQPPQPAWRRKEKEKPQPAVKSKAPAKTAKTSGKTPATAPPKTSKPQAQAAQAAQAAEGDESRRSPKKQTQTAKADQKKPAVKTKKPPPSSSSSPSPARPKPKATNAIPVKKTIAKKAVTKKSESSSASSTSPAGAPTKASKPAKTDASAKAKQDKDKDKSKVKSNAARAAPKAKSAASTKPPKPKGAEPKSTPSTPQAKPSAAKSSAPAPPSVKAGTPKSSAKDKMDKAEKPKPSQSNEGPGSEKPGPGPEKVKRKKKKAPKTTSGTSGTAGPKVTPEPKGAPRAAKAKAISSPQLVSVTRMPADKGPSSDSDVEIVAADINWSSRQPARGGPNGPTNPKRRAPEEVLAAALMDVLVPKPTGPDAADLSPAEAALLRRQQMRRRLSEASDWAQPVDVTAPAPPETDEELKKEKGRDVLEKLKTTQKQLLQLQLGIKQQQLEKLKARMRGKRSRNTFFPARPRRLPAQPATSAGASPEPSKPPPILADASA
eukprot:s253_g5.t4